VTIVVFTFGCAAWYALATGRRAASTQTVRLPDAVLLGAGLAGADAGVLAAVVAGALAGAVLAEDDVLADGAELDGDAVFFLELEQPANATAATKIGSHTRRCIFTAHAFTGSVEKGLEDLSKGKSYDV
jgi:hypothetical protein